VAQNIKEGIEGKPVSWYSQVFDLVFPNLDREKANTSRILEGKTEHGSKSDAEDGKNE